MLHLPPGPDRQRYNGGVTRRGFVQGSGLGLLSLPALLPAGASRAEGQGTLRAEIPTSARSVILIHLSGGLSHLDSFDPRPDAPAEVRGDYGVVRTKVPGVWLSERLPLLAARSDKFALVRSATHDSDDHETATNTVLSGRPGSPFGDYPAMGAVVAHALGDRGSLPAYFAIPRNPSFTWELGKSAFLGADSESFPTGDPNQEGFGRGLDCVLSSSARRALAIEREDDRLRDLYGRTTTGQGCLLARRLVEAGARFVTVQCAGWDHHRNIFASLDRRLPDLDRALSTLIDDLEGRGLLDSTLVVALSEFGRAPRLNHRGGRDHWSRVSSQLWAGGGVQPGQVIGSSDRHGAEVVESPVRPAAVAATIYRRLGVDYTRDLVTPGNRPIAILGKGAPIPALFA